MMNLMGILISLVIITSAVIILDIKEIIRKITIIYEQLKKIEEDIKNNRME